MLTINEAGEYDVPVNGQTIPVLAADVTNFMAAFKLKHGRDTTLSVDSVALLVARSEDDMDLADWVEAMLAAESDEDTDEDMPATDLSLPVPITDDEASTRNVAAASRQQNAVLAANRAAGDATLQAVFAKDIDSTEFKLKSAVLTLQRLLADYDGDWLTTTRCAFDDFPTWKSKLEDVGPNGNADEYKVYERSAVTNKMNEKSAWWWEAFARTMPVAIAAITEQANITKAQANDPTVDAKYRTMGTVKAKSEKARQKRRENAVILSVAKAVRIRQRMLEMKEMFPDVLVEFRTVQKVAGGPRELEDTNEPIAICDKADAKVWTPFPVSGFLSLDLAKAKADGGLYIHVVSAQKPRKAKTPTVAKLPDVSINNLDNYVATLATFWDNKSNAALLFKRLNGKPEDSDALLTSLAELKLELDAVFSDPAFRGRASKMGYVMGERGDNPIKKAS